MMKEVAMGSMNNKCICGSDRFWARVLFSEALIFDSNADVVDSESNSIDGGEIISVFTCVQCGKTKNTIPEFFDNYDLSEKEKTNSKIREYINENTNACPSCGCDDLFTLSKKFESGKNIYQKKCKDCSSIIEEYHQLIDVKIYK